MSGPRLKRLDRVTEIVLAGADGRKEAAGRRLQLRRRGRHRQPQPQRARLVMSGPRLKEGLGRSCRVQSSPSANWNETGTDWCRCSRKPLISNELQGKSGVRSVHHGTRRTGLNASGSPHSPHCATRMQASRSPGSTLPQGARLPGGRASGDAAAPDLTPATLGPATRLVSPLSVVRRQLVTLPVLGRT